MSTSDDPSPFPLHYTSDPLILLALNATSLNRTCSRVGTGRDKDKSPFRCSSRQREEAYLTLRCTMVQRVRTAAGVLAGNFLKIHFCPLSCMPASALVQSDHRLCLLVLRTALLGLARTSVIVAARLGIALESSSSPLLDGSPFSDTAAPTPMKQSAAPPVQEQPAPERGRFLNLVEQRTRMEPSLRLGRAAKMYSHERPSFHIWSSIISSSFVHGTLLFFGFNSA